MTDISFWEQIKERGRGGRGGEGQGTEGRGGEGREGEGRGERGKEMTYPFSSLTTLGGYAMLLG